MTLFDQYKKVYEKLLAAGKEYGLLSGQESAEREQEAQEKQEHVKKLQELLDRIQEYREDLEDIMRIVEPHITSRNFLNSREETTSRGDGKQDLLQERELNFVRLKRWASRIDPMNPDDPYAQRIYIQIICNQKYLDRKEKDFRDKLEAIKRADASAAVTTERIRKGRKKTSEILESKEFSAFVSALAKAHERNQSDPKGVSFSSQLPFSDEVAALGCYVLPLPVVPEFQQRVKENLKDYYDIDSSTIILPLEQSIVRDTIIVYSTDQMKLRIARQSLQRFLYGCCIGYPLGSYRIRVLDALHYNNSWLGPLKSIENTVLFGKVPGNEAELMDELKLTVAEFTDKDELLQTEDTVAEYNKNHENNPIAKQALVLIGYPDAFPSQARDYVNRILVNHERYGITVIVYQGKSTSDRDELEPYRDYLDATLIEMTAQDQTVMRYGSKQQQFRVYPAVTRIPDGLKEKLSEYEQNNRDKGEQYQERIGLTVQHTRGRKDIQVVLGADHKGQIPRISFDNENFAAFLMGASGSGKSTVLHTMITYLIQNYHPDDVELWLADFKMSEFAQYVNPMPPHVKYILLDESAELVYDFIDKLNEELQARQRIFKTKGWKNIKDAKDCYLPVIFVMIDEFSIMSQVIRNNMDYSLILQNMLSKGRALGFKFVFASQDYTKGIGGLTAMAKDQIQRRIAMRNNYDEIRDTLDLRASAITEQVRTWMEALPAHYAMVKEHETGTVSRLKTLYFAGEDAYKSQREMIEAMLQHMTKTEYTLKNKGVLKDPNAYIDKHGLVIDGNTFQGYNPEKLKKAATVLRQTDPCILQEDKLICPGRPRRLAEHSFFSLTNERRENILLVGRRQEWPCAVSVIASVCGQFRQQGGKTHIWAFRRNQMYMMHRKALEAAAKGNLLHEQESICDALHEVYEKMQRGIPGNDLFVLLGADRMFEGAENGARTGVAQSTEASISLDGVMASEDDMEEIRKHQTDPQDEDVTEEGNLALFAFFEKKANKKPAEPAAQSEQAAPAAPAAESMNPAQELAEILQEGSRAGYHMMVCAEQLPEIKAAGLKHQAFRHMLSFSMSEDDSLSLFGNKAAARIGQHICLYENGTEGWSLRPYIHKEVQWDDWSYNEKTFEATQL